MCVCVCVHNVRGYSPEYVVHVHLCVCVCVCERERERVSTYIHITQVVLVNIRQRYKNEQRTEKVCMYVCIISLKAFCFGLN